MWICHRCVCALCIQMPNYAGCAFCRWVVNHWIGVAMSGRIEEINLQGAHLMIFGSSKSKCDLPPWGKDLFLSFINTSRNPHHPFGTTQCHHSHPHLSEQVDATTMVALSLGRKNLTLFKIFRLRLAAGYDIIRGVLGRRAKVGSLKLWCGGEKSAVSRL